MSLQEQILNLEIEDDWSSDYSSDEEMQSTSFKTPVESKLRHQTIEKEQILTKFAKEIKTDEISISKAKTNKDKSDRATVDQVLDPRTLKFLKKIYNKGLITKFNGCLSTGKEANVYHAENEETGEEFAIKIYKTSILVFKDRERYVDGEFRFRNARSQHNPRKMIKIWAEKEFRNLKRLYLSKIIPAPQPLELKSHVLLMEFLSQGEGRASPKLRDYEFKDEADIWHYYHTMLSYIRFMYQKCRLVHADLSEYNSIVHNDKLYIIDVSQSVEHEHPMSLDFLRMDIKNVNDFFSRCGINVYPERLIFKFVIDPELPVENDESVDDLAAYIVENIPQKKTEEDEEQDQVFRSLHLVRSLNNIEERDFDRFTNGKFDVLTELVAKNEAGENVNQESEEENEEDSDEEDSDDEEEGEGKEWKEKETILKGKKHEDKDDKKDRKKAAKEAAKEKRKTKMKKHVKKKLVNKSKK